MAGIGSFDRGEANRTLSSTFCDTLSEDPPSVVGEDTDGNLKCCGRADVEVLRLVKGPPEMSGVVGAVPALRLTCRSGAAELAS
jgi:hypothetical protein